MAETINEGQSTPQAPIQPGAVIMPSGQATVPTPLPAASQPVVPAVQQPAPIPPVTPSPVTLLQSPPAAPRVVESPTAMSAPAATSSNQAPTVGGEVPYSASQSNETPQAGDGSVQWVASEFIAHEKSLSWYGGLAAASIVTAGVVYLLTKDVISTGVILFGALLLGVYGSRKPRQLQYSVGARGISIGQKHYGFGDFRSFSIAAEGAFASINFMPLKRFAPLTTIYYAPEDEDRILDILSQVLPFEEHKYDIVDQLMNRIRF